MFRPKQKIVCVDTDDLITIRKRAPPNLSFSIPENDKTYVLDNIAPCLCCGEVGLVVLELGSDVIYPPSGSSR